MNEELVAEVLTIYHNGQCSKSGGALEILQQRNVPHNVRWYLAEPLNEAELQDLLAKLGMKPSELVRRSEQLYREKYEGQHITEKEWLVVLAGHPELIERPIIEKGDRAIIARPPERVLEMI